MKIRKLQIAIMAAALAGVMSASASITLNFDDLATPSSADPGLGYGNISYGVMPISYQGLTWTGTWGVGDNATFKTAYNNTFSGNGKNFVYNENADLVLTVSDGKFDFNSAIFASWGASDAAWSPTYGPSASFITAQGYLNNVAVGAPVTMTLSPAAYQTLNANIAGIDKVVLTSDGWWVMDDFNYGPVPEPTTIIAGALLLLPFGASTLRMLRKNRKA